MVAEFQAIILAGGKGLSLGSLTNEDTPKCLLPVNDKPLLYYQLHLLETSKFDMVFIVIPEEMKLHVNAFLETYCGKISIQVVIIDNELETCDVLREMQDKIISDHFLVLSGDLISNVSIHSLSDIHRTKEATLTMLLKEERKHHHTFKNEKRENETIDCIGLTQDDQVVFLSRGAYMEETISFPKALLRKVPNMVTRTDVADVHLYLFSRSVFTVLQEKKKHLTSIKSDLVPYLIEHQWETDTTTSRCFAYLMKADSGYAARADTVSAYNFLQKNHGKNP